MFGQNRVIFVTVSRAISFHQWFMQGCDCNCCTFSLRGRGVGVRQISSLEAYRLTLSLRGLNFMLTFVLAGGILFRYFDNSQHNDIPNHRA